ncbi:superoxide dismutase [halophilic archaeon]|nr:superoxide dismutase [halophilic archaeon]
MPSDNSPSRTGQARRTVLKGLGFSAGLAAVGIPGAAAADPDSSEPGSTYSLPPLSYDYDALEPSIDAQIMKLHHDKHHQGYVEGANAALQKLMKMRDNGDFEDIKHIKRDLSFNLSGHILHSIFWEVMSPDGGGTPDGDLANAIQRDFGSISAFKREFSAAAENVEDSGWGMLVYDHLADQLLVTQAEDHNDLAVQAATPLLVLDVWEHAYYLQYQTERGKYVDAFWDIVDWNEVNARYKTVKQCDILEENSC